MKNRFITVFTVLLIVFGGALASAREKPPRDTPMEKLVMKDPAQVDPSDLTLGHVGDLHETGTPQVVTDLSAWRLELKGAALDSPLSLTYAELAAMPMVKKKVLLICPGFFADDEGGSRVALAVPRPAGERGDPSCRARLPRSAGRRGHLRQQVGEVGHGDAG